MEFDLQSEMKKIKEREREKKKQQHYIILIGNREEKIKRDFRCNKKHEYNKQTNKNT